METKLKILDLFAGTGSATIAFAQRDHDVHGIELESIPPVPGAGTIHHADILAAAQNPERWLDENIAYGWRPDVIWASPPCTVFSLAGKKSRWRTLENGDRVPADDAARLGCALVKATRHTINRLSPRFYWIENPRAGLRSMPFMRDLTPTTVWYCRYGDSRAKPTDLWGRWPSTWKPRPPCHNGNPDHEAAPRGARTGTQGISGARARSMVPYSLSLEIALACEEST